MGVGGVGTAPSAGVARCMVVLAALSAVGTPRRRGGGCLTRGGGGGGQGPG